MKLKLKAAVGSLLISGALAGAAGMPAAAGAHGNTGPLCYGNEAPFTILSSTPGIGANATLAYGEAFRIQQTVVIDGTFFSFGHSAGTYPADYWVFTSHLRC